MTRAAFEEWMGGPTGIPQEEFINLGATDIAWIAWQAAQEAAEQPWLPTAANVNALPEPICRYVHDIETKCDPAGDVAALTLLRDQVRALEASNRLLRDAAVQPEPRAILDGTPTYTHLEVKTMLAGLSSDAKSYDLEVVDHLNGKLGLRATQAAQPEPVAPHGLFVQVDHVPMLHVNPFDAALIAAQPLTPDLKDAQRYRWLKKVAADRLCTIAWGQSRDACADEVANDPDAAIDRAMLSALPKE